MQIANTRDHRAGGRTAWVVACLTAAVTFACSEANAAPHRVGLGKVLTSKDGGQIYGFDIDRNGDDGVLATAQDTGKGYLVSVETFDQNNGRIVKSFAKKDGPRDSYAIDGIFAGDVALITHYIVPEGSIYAKRKYNVMNPVAANAFTGSWAPPLKNIDVQMAADNQDTSTSVVFVIELKHNDVPDLIVSDVAANTFSSVIHLDPNLFALNTGTRLAQYTAKNMAVLASSPDGGAVLGQPPINALVDLATGKMTTFNGYNNGFYHAGYANGLAVDPNTGVAATTTELNAQVEFYDLNKKKGIGFTQLPCSGDTDQLLSGGAIANDPVNKLFLVTETNYCDGSQGSAIVVFDEKGKQIETITGFNPDAQYSVDQPPPRINPAKRMGWILGGPQGVNQLQQFFY